MRRKGFSLIEIVAAVVIVEVIAVSVIGLFSFVRKGNEIKRDRLNVALLMQRKVEEIKAEAFSRDVSEAASAFTNYPDYTFDVVQTVPYLGNSFLKKVDVTAFWTSPFGVSRQESLSFLVADR